MLPHMTTPSTARDLDVIRAALGEKKLNFLGVSYGTYLGAVYGTLFPTHVRRMVVDSVVNPARENIWYRANLNQNVAFQLRWDDWKAWLAQHDSVYGIGDTPQKVEQEWLKLRASAKKEPIGGVVGPAELIGFFQIVQAERDAATPYEGAVELQRRFKGSRLITEKGAGSHGVTGIVNPCVNDRVDTYLLTGKTDRRDVTCAPHATPKP